METALARSLRLLRWALFIAYLLAGAIALMVATPAGVAFLGLPTEALTFIPARVLGLPWSAPLFIFDDGPVTALAVLGICYGLNVGVTLMLARTGD